MRILDGFPSSKEGKSYHLSVNGPTFQHLPSLHVPVIPSTRTESHSYFHLGSGIVGATLAGYHREIVIVTLWPLKNVLPNPRPGLSSWLGIFRSPGGPHMRHPPQA